MPALHIVVILYQQQTITFELKQAHLPTIVAQQ